MFHFLVKDFGPFFQNSVFDVSLSSHGLKLIKKNQGENLVDLRKIYFFFFKGQ